VGEALIAALARSPEPGVPLTQALQTLGEPLTTAELVTLLKHPLAVDYAARALLEVLGHRHRHAFRNAWHFLDWAHANGVDFIPLAPSEP
jgi:hypothetical protein